MTAGPFAREPKGITQKAQNAQKAQRVLRLPTMFLIASGRMKKGNGLRTPLRPEAVSSFKSAGETQTSRFRSTLCAFCAFCVLPLGSRANGPAVIG
jgi:hypothetical protein